MIVPTKKRLTLIFTSVILLFTIIILIISYIFIHHSVMSVAKNHMKEDIRTEFLDQYKRSGIDPVSKMWGEHLFQILNPSGAVVVSSGNSTSFYPELNREMLQKAYEGIQGFEHRNIRGEDYLISYFPTDGKYVGRAALSLEEMPLAWIKTNAAIYRINTNWMFVAGGSAGGRIGCVLSYHEGPNTNVCASCTSAGPGGVPYIDWNRNGVIELGDL